MTSNFWQTIRQDLLGSGEWLKELGPWTKIISFFIFLLTLTGVGILGKDWWVTPREVYAAPAVWLLIPIGALVTFWLGSVYIRSRKPALYVGRLRPSKTSLVFSEGQNEDGYLLHMKVKNLGPGDVTPIVRVVYLRDGTGEALPIPEPFSNWEMHWRDKTTPKTRIVLSKGSERYSGVFAFVNDPPELRLYPIDLHPISLGEPKRGLRVKLIITYKPTDDSGIKQSEVPSLSRVYRIKPRLFGRPGYKVRRVWMASLFWD